MLFKKLAFVAAAASVNAQRPSDTPICDYYTTALLKNNTAENQLALLTVLVNTVVIGNCKSLPLPSMMPAIIHSSWPLDFTLILLITPSLALNPIITRLS